MKRDRHFAKYIKEWAKDQSILMELAGLLIADGMEEYYEDMDDIRKGKRIEGKFRGRHT